MNREHSFAAGKADYDEFASIMPAWPGITL